MTDHIMRPHPAQMRKPSRRMLTKPEVCARKRISGRRLDDMVKAGSFPKPTGYAGHMPYWSESDMIEAERTKKANFAVAANAAVSPRVTPKCEECGTPFVQAEGGRPRKYCSRACQQRSFRARKRAREAVSA